VKLTDAPLRVKIFKQVIPCDSPLSSEASHKVLFNSNECLLRNSSERKWDGQSSDYMLPLLLKMFIIN